MTFRRGQGNAPTHPSCRPHRRLRADRRRRDRRPGLARAARSTGSACRASTRPPASRPCWAAPSTAAGGSRPATAPARVQRRYRDDTLVLETDFETADGAVTVVDCMPRRDGPAGRRPPGRRAVGARSPMRMELVIRFDYGSVGALGAPLRGRGIRAVAGPDALAAHHRRARSAARASPPWPTSPSPPGERRSLVAGLASRRTCPPPPPVDADARAARRPRRGGDEWAGRCTYEGARSRRGGALPDHAQGAHLRAHRRHRRRADHLAARAARRRAQLGLPLSAGCATRPSPSTRLMLGGYLDEARAWREWLLRAVAGTPAAAADHVRPRGRAAADRARAADWLPGLRGLRARCASATRPTPSSSSTSTARCSTRRYAAHARPGSRRTGDDWRVISTLMRASRVGVDGAGRGHLGGARPAPALHPLQGDGVGGRRPHGRS